MTVSTMPFVEEPDAHLFLDDHVNRLDRAKFVAACGDKIDIVDAVCRGSEPGIVEQRLGALDCENLARIAGSSEERQNARARADVSDAVFRLDVATDRRPISAQPHRIREHVLVEREVFDKVAAFGRP